MKTQSTQLTVLNQNKFSTILTEEALAFLTALHTNFNSKRIELVKKERHNKLYMIVVLFHLFLKKLKP